MNYLQLRSVLSFLFFTCFCYSQNDSITHKKDSLVHNSKDIIDVYKKIFSKNDTVRHDAKKKIAFSLSPIPVEGNGETKIIVSFLSTFYLGDDHEKTKMSQVVFSPYFSFSSQYVFPIQSYIYTKDNLYNFTGDYRFMIYPQPTYGLGDHHLDDEMSILNYKQWRFYEYVTRKVKGNFGLGLGVLFDSYQNISEDSKIDGETDYFKYMSGDYSDDVSFGVAIQALYDSRINNINPEQGTYLEANFRMNTNGGLDNKGWQSVYIDARKYHSFSDVRHKILAYRAFYWSTIGGGDPHYLDLPSIGWDRQQKTGRGFTRNRFRSNALLYFETEYRTDISADGFWGAVFFTNISSVSKFQTNQFTKWNPAIGTGLRIKWNKRNNSNLVMDFGVSKNDWSLRFGLVENF